MRLILRAVIRSRPIREKMCSSELNRLRLCVRALCCRLVNPEMRENRTESGGVSGNF